ncbi:hypothetical protein MHBO_000449 [Bonamia ostreae]
MLPDDTDYYNSQIDDSSDYEDSTDDKEQILKPLAIKKAFQTNQTAWHLTRLPFEEFLGQISGELNNVLSSKYILLKKYIIDSKTNIKNSESKKYDKNVAVGAWDKIPAFNRLNFGPGAKLDPTLPGRANVGKFYSAEKSGRCVGIEKPKIEDDKELKLELGAKICELEKKLKDSDEMFQTLKNYELLQRKFLGSTEENHKKNTRILGAMNLALFMLSFAIIGCAN